MHMCPLKTTLNVDFEVHHFKERLRAWTAF